VSAVVGDAQDRVRKRAPVVPVIDNENPESREPDATPVSPVSEYGSSPPEMGMLDE
jgi:hypothetical protein